MLIGALGKKLSEVGSFGRKLASNALNFGAKVANKVKDVSNNVANVSEKILNGAENLPFGLGEVVKNTVSPYARLGIQGARKVSDIASQANGVFNVGKFALQSGSTLEKAS